MALKVELQRLVELTDREADEGGGVKGLGHPADASRLCGARDEPFGLAPRGQHLLAMHAAGRLPWSCGNQ